MAGGLRCGRTAVLAIIAFTQLSQLVLVVAGVIVGVGAAGLAGVLTWRWRRPRLTAARTVSPLPPFRYGPPSCSHSRRGARSSRRQKSTYICLAPAPAARGEFGKERLAKRAQAQ